MINCQTIHEHDLHIEIGKWINSEDDKDNVILFITYVPADSENVGKRIIKKSKLLLLIEYIEQGFYGNEEIIDDDFIIRQEAGRVTLNVEYTSFYNMDTRISVELSGEKLEEFIKNVRTQVNHIDWENYGKIYYSIANLPSENAIPYRSILSADQFQLLFYHKSKGKELKTILIGQRAISDFYDICCREKGKSYEVDCGGPIIFVFDEFCVELIIHAEGLFCYRIIEGYGEEKFLKKFDYLPSLRQREETYLEIESFVDYTRDDKVIKEIIVEKTDMFAFAYGDVNELKKAAERFDLPSQLNITFENGSNLKFIGDTEFFYISASGSQCVMGDYS